MTQPREKLQAPEGTHPMMISMREMETLGLKTGTGIRETLPYKVFQKSEILEQISQVGFMCPFHEHRADISKLQGDEILIIADPTEQYGENWLICLTRKAFDTQMAELLAQENEIQRLREAEEKEQRDKISAEENLANVEYEDSPILAKDWNSITAEDTHNEVDMLTVRPNRPLIKLCVTKMSNEFNTDYKFTDRDADQCFVEWRQHKDPNYELVRLEQEVGLQGFPPLVDNCTQTSWFRSVNTALQYEPQVLSLDTRVAEMDTDKMHKFLSSVLPTVEEALQQNETIDIFTDSFANLVEDDSVGLLLSKTENAIKELRSFTDLVYSKNKTLSAVDWHPKKNGVVAVAAATNAGFNKRMEILDKVDPSYILIWNFADLIHPQLMLEAPQDVLTLRFNPTQPHIIAAGLYNGQIAVWDFSKAEHCISKMKINKSNNASKGNSDINAQSSASPMNPRDSSETAEVQNAIPIVKPLYTSYIDLSHRRAVTDLQWLPQGMEVNTRGHLISAPDILIQQFLTIAGDGQAVIWDLRFKDPKYRASNRQIYAKTDKNPLSSTNAGSSDGNITPEVYFAPIYAIALTKPECTGEFGLKCFAFERPQFHHYDDAAVFFNAQAGGTSSTQNANSLANVGSNSGPSNSAKNVQPISSRFYCGTEEGEFAYIDWRPHAASRNSRGDDDFNGDNNSTSNHQSISGGTSAGIEYVQWAIRDHYRPIVALCGSPFFPYMYLTANESHFHLWNVSQLVGRNTNDHSAHAPMFVSPLSVASISCGTFSPSRPGVIYIGKCDGTLEVWDFLDQSHKCSLSIVITAYALTSIQFRPHVTLANTNNSNNSSNNSNTKLQESTIGSKNQSANPSTNPTSTTSSGNAIHKQQLVAIGDQNGNLHIMEIPRSLSRGSLNEKQAMESFLKRESDRVNTLRSAMIQPQSRGLNESNRYAELKNNDNRRTENTSDTILRKDITEKDLNAMDTIDDTLFKRMELEFCQEFDFILQ